MATEKMKFIIIKTNKDGVFISDNVNNNGYFNSQIGSLRFEGEEPIPTFHKDWFKISYVPSRVEKKGNNILINRRYELKAGYPVSELTPAIIPNDQFDTDDDIAALYTLKYETQEGVWEKIEFECEIIAEELNFYVEKPKYSATSSIMTQMTVLPVLQTQHPVALSGKEFYRIIREHIKRNIDGRYARITSDYDFCLSVEKYLALAQPQKYTVDIGTKRKPNIQTKYNQNRAVKVFESSPEGYSNYPTQQGISGKNQKDLEEKVDQYLEELMVAINAPLKECTNCNGTGCVIDK